MIGWLVRRTAGTPRLTTPPDGLDAALSALGRDVDAAALTAVAEALVAATVVTTGGLTLVTPARFQIVVAALGLAAAAGAWWLLVRGPFLLAAARRRRALGTAPWLVCRGAMRLRVTPTVESAAAFAARDDDRLLSRRLAAHVRRARGTPRTGFDGLRGEWGERFPPLDRAVASLQAAAAAPEGDRAETVERALDTVVEGVRHRAAADAAALQGPVTALYAFGVLLPLALVAALPAAAVAGLPLTVPVLVVGYDLLLPAVLVAAGAWLLARRPVTFPAVAVPSDHPAVPDRQWPPLVAGGVTAVVAGVVAHVVTGPWAAPVAAVGVGSGVALVGRFRHEHALRERTADIETSLSTILTRVGRAVTDGQSVEHSLEAAASTVAGPGGERVATAVDRMDRLGVSVEAALLGEYGAFTAVPSPRAAGTARLLAAAAREGRPAGTALVAAGDNLASLRRVERETRRELARLTTTMGNTAAVFGPLVGGVTVALAGRMHGSALGHGLSVATLGPIVGWYVLCLAVVLAALAAGLERGFDRALVGYRVGWALVAATTTYLVALHAARIVT